MLHGEPSLLVFDVVDDDDLLLEEEEESESSSDEEEDAYSDIGEHIILRDHNNLSPCKNVGGALLMNEGEASNASWPDTTDNTEPAIINN